MFKLSTVVALVALTMVKGKKEVTSMMNQGDGTATLTHRKLSTCETLEFDSMIGDNDGLGIGVAVGAEFDFEAVTAGPAEDPGTDVWQFGDQTYVHMLELEGVSGCTLTTATLEIQQGGIGFGGEEASVSVDGVLVGTLTQSDGSVLPGSNILSNNVFDLIPLIAGIIGDPSTLEVDTFLSGDGWAMDFTKLTVAFECGDCTNGAGGDPHFSRWHQPKRDSFHGECDLVLFSKERFNAALEDLIVHIRTTIKDSFSYIESSVMKIGNDVLEFQTNEVLLNGLAVELVDHKVFFFGPDAKYSITLSKDPKNEKNRRFKVDLQDAVVTVRATDYFMRVSVAGTDEVLDGSVGMLGDHKTGDMLSRDGNLMDSFLDFGFEWQVHPGYDPVLFQEARSPQLPYERCIMPSSTASVQRARKLRATNRALMEEATAACSKNHNAENVQSCIDDVLLTGNMDLAEAW